MAEGADSNAGRAGGRAVPGAANGPVLELIEVVKDLTAVMAQEVTLLRAMQIREFSGLQERKNFLVDAYERLSLGLRKDPAFGATLDPLLRNELRELLEDMQSTLAHNETAIRAAREANERLAKAIVAAVGQKKAETGGYSAKGQTGKGPSEPVSVQIDQRL